VIPHNTPAMQQQTSFGLAMPDTFYNDITIFLSGKHIYPLHNRKSYKMDSSLISYFVTTIAHVLTKIACWYLRKQKPSPLFSSYYRFF